MRMERRLGREDWLAAGYAALAQGGVAGVRVEPVARELSVTKGSFYWHFRDREEWCRALLAYWEHRAFCGLLGKGAAPPDARVEAAIRQWALRDVAAAQALSRVVRERARDREKDGVSARAA